MHTPQSPNNQSTLTNPVGRFMVAVGAIIEHIPSHTILIIQRSKTQDWHPGEWEIGYGRIAQFEEPESGLLREIKEEVGITSVTIERVLRTWHLYRGYEKTVENDLVGITFHCTTTTQTTTLSDEHQGYQWVSPEDALNWIKEPGIRKDVETFIMSSKNQESKLNI